MAPGCIFCGVDDVELHHVTGRPAPGRGYLDPDLVVPLCRRHHAQEHELLLRQRLAFLPGGSGQLAGRVVKLGAIAGRLADAKRELQLSSRGLIGLRGLLLDVADQLPAIGVDEAAS